MKPIDLSVDHAALKCQHEKGFMGHKKILLVICFSY